MASNERKIHTIDASGQSTGRLASRIAVLLRGKHKPEYRPNTDGGDIVVVKNIGALKFTGKKLEQKKYYRYSGYPGGLKTKTLKEAYANDPAFVLKQAVRKMLPATRLRTGMLKRLRVS